MSDIYNNKWLRRWSLNSTGHAECTENAVNIELISEDDRAAIEEKNADIHQAIADVISLEKALLVIEPETTRTYRVYEEPEFNPETNEYEEKWHMENRPEWIDWDYAQSIILNASEEIKALLKIRSGEASEIEKDLVENRWGYEVEIEIRPDLPDLEPAQFWGVVFATGNDVGIENYIEQVALSDPMTAGLIKGRVVHSKAYRRYDPLTETMRQWNNMSETEFNSLWNWAASTITNENVNE